MAEELSVDKKLFTSRLEALQKSMSRNGQFYGNTSVLEIIHGKRSEGLLEEPHNVSLQLWLFGYELPETIVIFTGDTLFIHASEKKLKIFGNIEAETENSVVRVKLFVREKGDQSIPNNALAFKVMIDAILSKGKTLGRYADEHTGQVTDLWFEAVKLAGIEYVDSAYGIESYLAIKDEAAMADLRGAGDVTCRIMKRVLLKKMSDIIEDEKEVTNAEFSSEVSTILDDIDLLKKHKVEIDTDRFECVMGPVVESGGVYDQNIIRVGIKSSDTPFSPDVVCMALATRYKSMRAALARTYLIDPTEQMKKYYDTLSSIYENFLTTFTAGAVVSDLTTAVRMRIGEADLPAEVTLVKNHGAGIGARLVERYGLLTGKNGIVLEPGMSFAVVFGANTIPLNDKHPIASAKVNSLSQYCIVFADTVLVTSSGPVVLTSKASFNRKDVSYEMAEDEKEEEEEEDEEEDEDARQARRQRKEAERQQLLAAGGGRDASGRSARLREKQKFIDPKEAEKRQARLEELIQARTAEAERAIKSGAAFLRKGQSAEDTLARQKPIVSYAGVGALPRLPMSASSAKPQAFYDQAADSLLLPLRGLMVPFHISTLKSVTKQSEGDRHFLRVDFMTISNLTSKDVSPQFQAAAARHPDLLYLRSLTLTSRSQANFADIEIRVKKNLKEYRDRRRDLENMEGVIEQPRLQLAARPIPLNGVFCYPPVTGRKSRGNLYIHQNGLSFRTDKADGEVHIVFSNIRTAVFQPAQRELLTLLHFHLKDPILVNKKKVTDIQFYTEVGEKSIAISDVRRNDDDADEEQAEENERMLREKINSKFKEYAKLIENQAATFFKSNPSVSTVPGEEDAKDTLTFEKTSPELTFNASITDMRPFTFTTSSIVSLAEHPPVCIPASEINFAHLQRLRKETRAFDLVVVKRDGTVLELGSIETRYADNIRAWLADVGGIVYTESEDAYKWDDIVTDFAMDPYFWLPADAEGRPKNIGMGMVLLPSPDELEGEEGEEGEGGGEDEDEEEDEDESESEFEEEDDDDEDEEEDSDDYDEDSDEEDDYEDEDDLSDIIDSDEEDEDSEDERKKKKRSREKEEDTKSSKKRK